MKVDEKKLGRRPGGGEVILSCPKDSIQKIVLEENSPNMPPTKCPHISTAIKAHEKHIFLTFSLKKRA